MELRRIAVVGGGPGGLYVARLVALARPGWDVRVYERDEAGATFGFGVGLTPSTLRNLAAADPESAGEILRAGHSGHGLRLRVGDESVDLHGARNIAIGRAALLDVLRRHAEAAGVLVSYGAGADLVDPDADVVIAADGARSAVRAKLAAELGVTASLGRGLYLWCGADFALDDAVFEPAWTEHGLFVAHAYPYAVDRSTVLIETDERSWRCAGLDEANRLTRAGESDRASLEYLRWAFGSLLGGRPLLGNRTRWQRFATVRAARWHHGNVVLLGDAAHTAHYTLGSGTKLALEGAVELATNLTSTPSSAQAFRRYERNRRPAVERFQRLAVRSQWWWESFPARVGLPLPQLAVSFLTRAGNLDVPRLAEGQPDLVTAAMAAYAGEPPPDRLDGLDDWVLGRPLRVGGLRAGRREIDPAEFASWRLVRQPSAARLRSARAAGTGPVVACIETGAIDPWGAEAVALAERCARLETADALWLTGPDPVNRADPVDPVTRLALAEHVRLRTGQLVGADLPAAAREAAVSALLTGRIDAVRLR